MSKNKKHICLNMIADPNWHAGNIYITNIIEAINCLPREERDRIKLSIVIRKELKGLSNILPKVDNVYRDTFFHLAFYKLLRLLPSFCRIRLFNFRKIDFYYPAGNLPGKWIFKWGGWIPDFQYRHLPDLFSDAERNNREKRNLFLAKESSVLALSSEHALNDYLRYFAPYKGNEFLLHFVSFADEDWLKPNPVLTQKKFNLPDRFYIVCNQFWAHKDHGTVIEAMHLLKQQGIPIHVVCTGSTEDFRNPDYYSGLLKQVETFELSDQFHSLGFISRSDQIQLIRRSLAIIQPSLFEGWSTVVEDGRSLGKTIFLSDFPVHVEQNPPFSMFFQQKNAQQLAKLIEKHNNELAPGPEPEREAKALKQNHQLMLGFGRRFILMANSC